MEVIRRVTQSCHRPYFPFFSKRIVRMDDLLSELGVVNGDETDMMLKVQSLVEENESAKAVAGMSAQGEEGTLSTATKGSTRVENANVNKRSVLESIMDGANAALDLSKKTGVHTLPKDYKKIEKVKFISALEDIPNNHEKEMRFSGGKRGYYDASTSLNLFSNAGGGGVQQYRNSTNVDNEALLSIVRDAKVGNRTKRSKLLDNEYSPEYDEPVVDDASQWQSEDEIELSVQDSLPQASAASSSRDILCPICNRNLGHGDSTAQNTVMLDRHVERCARRGSRNVTNYALAGSEGPDEEEEQRMPNSRSSKRSTLKGSSSSMARASSASKATSSSSSNGSALKITDGGNDEELLDFSLFDDESLGGSDWEGGRYSDNNKSSSSSRGGSRVQQQNSSVGGGARSLRSLRSTRSSHSNNDNTSHINPRSSARRSATSNDNSNSEAEFDAVNPVSKVSSSRNKAVKPVAKSPSKSSLNSTSIASDDDDDDDAQGFVASIVDDWEDAAYDHRLALVAEAFQQSKVKANKRRKLEKAKKKQADDQFVDSAFVDFTNAEADPTPEQPQGSSADEGNDEDNGSEYIRTDYGTEMLRSTYQKLHQYQRDGCRWLHELYEEGVGGILGDEMGTLSIIFRVMLTECLSFTILQLNLTLVSALFLFSFVRSGQDRAGVQSFRLAGSAAQRERRQCPGRTAAELAVHRGVSGHSAAPLATGVPPLGAVHANRGIARRQCHGFRAAQAGQSK